nr:MAG TPA: hypothetical protein [Caudoviricetes sp.]
MAHTRNPQTKSSVLHSGQQFISLNTCLPYCFLSVTWVWCIICTPVNTCADLFV